MKGVISETMISGLAIALSLLLIVLIANALFSTQNAQAVRATYSSVARGIISAIEKSAATAGSVALEYEVPKGLSVNITIGRKAVEVSGDGVSSAKPFAADTNTGVYSLDSPLKVCITKNSDDGRITAVSGDCSCDKGDGQCDPVCLFEDTCDSDCVSGEIDNFCSVYCLTEGDAICDPDCYSNRSDMVWDKDCIDIYPGNDTICDPDIDMKEDADCDPDCLMNATDGICALDCMKARDSDSDGYEDINDSICDFDCIGADGICDLDCAENENICDPDCPQSVDQCDPCAKEGESFAGKVCCEDLDLIPCPGTGTCEKKCCGNGVCEVVPFAMSIYDKIKSSGWSYGGGTHSFADFEQVSWAEDSSPENWENFYTCPEECAYGDLVCVGKGGPHSDPDCPAYCRPGNGDHQYDCCVPHYSAHLGYWSVNYDFCPYVAFKQSEDDGICTQVIDDGCDPDCKDVTDICDPDCCSGDRNSESACSDSPGCQCSVRVDKSDAWTATPCNTEDGNNQFKELNYYEGNIEVCHPDVIDFLDRRGWDINQIAENLLRGRDTPLGWAFDNTRYMMSCENMQSASETINGNDNYLGEERVCCCTDRRGGTCPTGNWDETCCDTGFCGDHAPALLSILRTLGVPYTHVWATHWFAGNCKSHAFVVYKCDKSLPWNMKLDECGGHWGEWLRLDATSHEIVPLDETGCSHMCLWFNDHGLYPMTPEGETGETDSGTGLPIGRPYPEGVKCASSTWKGGETCSTGSYTISCEFTRICEENGVKCEW